MSTGKNKIMQYALERAKKHIKSKRVVTSVNVDANGVDLNVLDNGGVTSYKGCDVYVHTDVMSRVLPKGKWHFRDANGYRVYIKCLKREKAQEFVNTYYGKGKYSVSSSYVD